MLVTSETGILPMRGNANRFRFESHSREAPIVPDGTVLFHA